MKVKWLILRLIRRGMTNKEIVDFLGELKEFIAGTEEIINEYKKSKVKSNVIDITGRLITKAKLEGEFLEVEMKPTKK